LTLPSTLKIHTLLIFMYLLINLNSFGQQGDSLMVVSWNVFLRPSILSDGQMSRVDSIGNYLLTLDADVVVLQEVFHKRARRRLLRRLKSRYPYYTKKGRKTFFGIPSGICILSKDSIIVEAEISYKRAKGADRLAKKGASLIHIEHHGKAFNIFGTHLQAGGGDEGVLIRKSQLNHLGNFVRAQPDSVTSIFVGDFNIWRSDTLYDNILQCLNAVNSEPSGKFKATANFNDHKLTNPSGKAKWIDYILLKKERKVRVRSSHIEEPRCHLKRAKQRISDHNPIITIFEW
jgi:phospholipase C